MSRELILSHAGACFWSASTCDPFAANMYECAGEDEGVLTAELLNEVRAELLDKRKFEERSERKLEALMKCRDVDYNTYNSLYCDLMDTKDAIIEINDSMSFVDLLLRMVEELKHNDENVDKEIKYIKSY